MMFSAFSPLISMSDLADRPGVVVKVLPVEDTGSSLAVVLAQVVLGDRKHAACAARRVVDRLDDM